MSTEPPPRLRWVAAAGAALAVLVVDRITKSLVRSHITPGDHVDVLPGIDFVHTTNRGIAFGLFPGHQRLVAALTALALCAIAIALVRAGRRSTTVLVGAGMLVGGAIGNLVDRLTHDGVTDFIAITSHWPPFNVADIGVVCGALVAVLGLTRPGGE